MHCLQPKLPCWNPGPNCSLIAFTWPQPVSLAWLRCPEGKKRSYRELLPRGLASQDSYKMSWLFNRESKHLLMQIGRMLHGCISRSQTPSGLCQPFLSVHQSFGLDRALTLIELCPFICSLGEWALQSLPSPFNWPNPNKLYGTLTDKGIIEWQETFNHGENLGQEEERALFKTESGAWVARWSLTTAPKRRSMPGFLCEHLKS